MLGIAALLVSAQLNLTDLPKLRWGMTREQVARDIPGMVIDADPRLDADNLKFGARGKFEGADALAIMTEWKDYHSPDFAEMYQMMKAPVIFDGRNLYEPDRMKRRGYRYYSIGRPVIGCAAATAKV